MLLFFLFHIPSFCVRSKCITLIRHEYVCINLYVIRHLTKRETEKAENGETKSEKRAKERKKENEKRERETNANVKRVNWKWKRIKVNLPPAMFAFHATHFVLSLHSPDWSTSKTRNLLFPGTVFRPDDVGMPKCWARKPRSGGRAAGVMKGTGREKEKKESTTEGKQSHRIEWEWMVVGGCGWLCVCV